MHNDTRHSLSVGYDNGKILFKCHANTGCHVNDICAALGLEVSDLFTDKRQGGQRTGGGEIVATYDYRDTDGSLLFQVCRTAGKGFFQRRPDGAGWKNGLGGVKPVLYRLPELALAVQSGAMVFVLEGEKDSLNLARLGLAATTNPMGAGKWREHYSDWLKGAACVILPDNDEPGRKHAEQVAQSLHGKAASVKVLALPNLPAKGDVSDWLAAGGTTEELLRLAGECPEWQDNKPNDEQEALAGEAGPADEKKPKKAQAEILLEVAACATYFHDDLKDPYALVPVGDHFEIYRLRERAFKRWLTRQMYDRTGKVANSDAMSQALNLLEAKAIFDGQQHSLNLRVAEQNGIFYYDLANFMWQAVTITANGWTCVNRPPIIFKRCKNTAAQVNPIPGGDLSQVLEFVNLQNEDDKILLQIYLVAALVPGIPHPMPVLAGGQGAAKTTAMRLMRRLIDPAVEELLSLPNDPAELALLLSSNYLPYFDNLDGLAAWQSDMLCRAVTGGGIPKRQLYTDDEEVILRFLRCVGLNGINPAATRPDLLDRSMIFTLERINPGNRREEKEFWRAFDIVRPKLVGAMLDALASAMRLYPQTALPELPRMADFARWGWAIAEALGIGGSRFLEAYWQNIGQQNEAAIQNHPVAAAVVALMETTPFWTGTPAELLTTLEKTAENEKISVRAKTWPKAAHSLTRRLREVKSNLADAGIEYIDDRTKSKRRATLQRVDKIASPASSCHKLNNDGASCGDAKGDAFDLPISIASPGASPEKVNNDGENDVGDAGDAIFANFWQTADLRRDPDEPAPWEAEPWGMAD